MKALRRAPVVAFALAVLTLVGVVATAGGANERGPAPVSDHGVASDVVPLGAQQGTATVAVNLSVDPLAVANAKAGGHLSKAQQHAQLDKIKTQQDALIGSASSLGGKAVGRLTNALNAVIFRIDHSKVGQLATLPNVTSVHVVRNYELSLASGDQTVAHIGAAALHSAGVKGDGVTVAILDTGTDYTHADLGGSGSDTDYKKAYGTSLTDKTNTKVNPSVFPTAKVVGGFDFVGEAWDGVNVKTESPDPNPIDCSPDVIPGCKGGHGTHVADILAGVGPSPGVAPGAKILSYKVCSSVSTACDGVALLEGVDRAMDPNQDGDISDHADVLSLSLGSPYGQDQDDLTAALNNASDAGAIVVAAAGNNGNLPYVVSSPSIGKNVISVAQTQVPEALGYAIKVNSPSGIAPLNNTATLDWAPVGNGVTGGDVTFVGRGCPAGAISTGSPADPYLADPAGKVALIDRGACSISQKVDRAAQAGAIGVIIGLVAPGDPISFSFGGPSPFHSVPSLVITQAESNTLKTAGGTVNVTYGPSTSTPLVNSMVSTSARGPSYSRNSIKPDIGAPGAADSAEAGTGTGTTPFGGTSGATPMVSGSAALLHGAFPNRAPFEIKSVLMNTAETNIKTNPMTTGNELAPITRIGGGEVRVDAAYHSTTAAWDSVDKAGSLSFGYVPLATTKQLTRTVVVRNYSNASHTYSIHPTFRFANNQSSGAVAFSNPSSITVGANSQGTFTVTMTITPSKLPTWTLDGGPNGGNGARLNTFEYDGYLNLDGGTNSNIHLAWQVLPHRSADVSATTAGPQVKFSNASSVLDGGVEAFSLTGTSPQIPASQLPGPGSNRAVIDLKAVGVRTVSPGTSADPLVQFGISTFGQRSHPNVPAEFDVYIDSNNDGTPDYVVFNLENGGSGTSGRNVDEVFNLTTKTGRIFFFTDADLNSGNAILTAPMSAVGLTPSTTFSYSVFAFDNYFTGQQTDSIEHMTYTLGTPKFTLGGPSSFSVPASKNMNVSFAHSSAGDTASPSQQGFLLLYRDAAAPDNESQAVTLP